MNTFIIQRVIFSYENEVECFGKIQWIQVAIKKITVQFGMSKNYAKDLRK